MTDAAVGQDAGQEHLHMPAEYVKVILYKEYMVWDYCCSQLWKTQSAKMGILVLQTFQITMMNSEPLREGQSIHIYI